MVSETKLGACKYCGNPYHRGWQCSQRPKKEKKQKVNLESNQKTRVKHNCERKDLINKFDKVYSRYIRLLQIVNSGHCRCFICGKRLSYENACVGHYISRRYAITRFDEKNANVICYDCNMIDNHSQDILQVYAKRIDEEYGSGTADELFSKAHTQKLTSNELNDLYENYKIKLKELEKEYERGKI